MFTTVRQSSLEGDEEGVEEGIQKGAAEESAAAEMYAEFLASVAEVNSVNADGELYGDDPYETLRGEGRRVRYGARPGRPGLMQQLAQQLAGGRAGAGYGSRYDRMLDDEDDYPYDDDDSYGSGGYGGYDSAYDGYGSCSDDGGYGFY